MSALAVEGLSKAFDGETAVDDVSLALERGEFFSLIGPSGCGKTTTLRVLAGLLRPDAGTVRIDGRDVTDRPARTRATNIVFQDLVLFPHMTVAENIAYGLARSGVPEPDRRTRVAEVLDLVNLAGADDRDPADLSGGQRQRVALARALVNEPAVLLLDEPLASLDRALREEMQREFRRIQRTSDTTFLYVTHDQESAMSMSDRVAVMRDGRIVGRGPPRRLYGRPPTRFVAEFLGDATVLDATVVGHDGGAAVVDTPAGRMTAVGDPVVESGDAAAVAIRPEAVSLGDGDLAGEVVDVAYKGFYETATVDCDGVRLSVRREHDDTVPDTRPAAPDGGPPDSESPFRVGTTVRLRIESAVLLRNDDD